MKKKHWEEVDNYLKSFGQEVSKEQLKLGFCPTLVSFKRDSSGAIIGLAMGTYLEGEGAMELQSIIVSEPHRQQGIGTGLLMSLMNKAWKKWYVRKLKVTARGDWDAWTFFEQFHHPDDQGRARKPDTTHTEIIRGNYPVRGGW